METRNIINSNNEDAKEPFAVAQHIILRNGWEYYLEEEEAEAPVEPAAEAPAEPEKVEEPKEEPKDELSEAKGKVAELQKKLEEVLNQVDSKASAEEEL